jgi:hypothetical protein
MANTLRALNPATEQELFCEAFNWRTSPKKHTRVDRMPFEQFSADYSNQVVMGLFNGELCAVYMFIEVAPKEFEAHFSSRKDASHADVFAGAKTMVDWFHSQGAVITASIVERNRPLRAFVESLGFVLEKTACQEVKVKGKVESVKYLSRMDYHDQPNGTLRQSP